MFYFVVLNVKSTSGLVIVHGSKLLIVSGEILLVFCRDQMRGVAKGLLLYKWLN